jgi:hypothetical protein
MYVLMHAFREFSRARGDNARPLYNTESLALVDVDGFVLDVPPKDAVVFLL